MPYRARNKAQDSAPNALFRRRFVMIGAAGVLAAGLPMQLVQ